MNKNNNKEKCIWIAIGMMFLMLILSIAWFNHILTTHVELFSKANYENFLIKYYTTQNNWLNFGLYIVTIALAVIGIVFAIDYKTKKEELEKFVEDKLSKIDYIVDSYNYPKTSTDSKTNSNAWYEKYKSGKVKQGGNIYLNSNIYNEFHLQLLVSYKSDNYSFFYNVINPNEKFDIDIVIKEKNSNCIIFKIHNYTKTDKPICINWTASGNNY